MKVSIIIPIYNMEKYLRRCLDSILVQDINDIEIILVDDGSKDNSLKICKEYEKRDRRIRIIEKINGGVSSARNAGLDVARGEYIIFIDPDDYIDRDMFSNLYNLGIKNNADLIWLNFYKDEKELVKIVDENEVFDLNNTDNLKIFASMVDKKFHMSAFLFGKVYKRSILENIRFPLNRLCEDGFVLAEILYRCKKVVLLTDAYYHYCQREDGLCLSNRGDAWHIDWIESRLVQAITYNEWCKDLDNGQREYMLYRAYRNALLFMPNSMREKYKDVFPILQRKLKELLNGNMSFRHKLSIWKVLLKYRFARKG